MFFANYESMTDLKTKIAQLEETIAKLKESISTVEVVEKRDPLQEKIVFEVVKHPMTIEEIAKHLKVSRAIANAAIRRLAWSERVRMVSEKGTRRERFRIYTAEDVALPEK